MIYKQTTQVPNILFDTLIPTLTEAEIKLLLVIMRQTYGWVGSKTGKRKQHNRISRNQFLPQRITIIRVYLIWVSS